MPPGRRTPSRYAARLAAVVITFALGLPIALSANAAHAESTPSAGVSEQAQRVDVAPEPDGTPVTIDTTIYAPTDGARHPAVLLGHGFGGSKNDVVDQARELADGGYVVVAWTARGFGASGGRIHLDDPKYEVADASRLVDLLARRPDVRLDAPGDPRVGVVGGSYGGALALMLGALDKRVDTVAALITWNDLGTAFFPQHATTGAQPTSPAQLDSQPQPGPFKQLWASTFLLSAFRRPGPGSNVPQNTTDTVCGRFDETVCALFVDAAQTGKPSADLLTLMTSHSPKSVLSGLTVPTYLIQGMADSLFPLDQADATARALTAQGTPVAVRWIDGGHDGTSSTEQQDRDSVHRWLDHYLLPDAKPASKDPMPVPAFVFASPIPRRQSSAPLQQADSYVGVPTTTTDLPMTQMGPRRMLSPAGGQPTSVTTIPVAAAALGADAGVAAWNLATTPGQWTAFDTGALADRIQVVGAPHLRMTLTSSGTEASLFVSLWQVTGSVPTLTRRLIAPLTVPTTPNQPATFDVALPAATWNLEPGSAVRVLITTTDSAYQVSPVARLDRVQIDGAGLRVPTVAATTYVSGAEQDTETLWLSVALAALLVGVGALAWLMRRRRLEKPFRPEHADVPLVVDGLVKTYADGHRAVDDVSWRAERGQVVGLLGPNGAGKTTTLRMVMGLIRADSGTAYVLGWPTRAGAPVLARVGALIEGPGFLPHLSGRANLHAYWRATGRPEHEAAYDEVLEVAALGDAIERPVRSYSHGMKQRLGIAQAMLGMPEVLVLDEPTNGLDPPQIAAMRPILHRYAASGRTVVVSSHLLAEVEMTCSHVVVMHAGRVVTSGSVPELLDSADTTVVQLAAGADAQHAADEVTHLRGVLEARVEQDPVEPRLVVTADLPRADVVRAVVESGADVVGVTSRRHLEEVFLGVIAAAQGADGDSGSNGTGARTLTDRLRQVRSR